LVSLYDELAYRQIFKHIWCKNETGSTKFVEIYELLICEGGTHAHYFASVQVSKVSGKTFISFSGWKMYIAGYCEDLLTAVHIKLTHITEGFNMINKLLYTRLKGIVFLVRFYQRKYHNCLI